MRVLILLLIIQAVVVESNRKSSEFNPKYDEHTWTTDFLFPDQLPRVKKQLSVSNGAVVKLNPFLPSPCEDDEDFCEDASDYPDPLILSDKVRNKTKSLEFAILFNQPDEAGSSFTAYPTPRLRPGVVDSILTSDSAAELPPATPYSHTPTTYVRGKTAGPQLIEESPVCASKTSIIYPRKARNLDREWRFIVNDNNEHSQAVKVEKCIGDGKRCDIGGFGVQTVCRQKSSYRKLAAFHPTTGEPYIETLLLPSCCICMKQNIVDYSAFELLRTQGRTVVLEDENSKEELNREKEFEDRTREIEREIIESTPSDRPRDKRTRPKRLQTRNPDLERRRRRNRRNWGNLLKELQSSIASTPPS